MTISIAMITYNHAQYIKQAIEGILMQETNFDFELIISDDCSTDNTQEIIQNIIDTNPNGSKIKYFNHKKNLGPIPNFIFTLEKCQGKYVALCEGDDYWTDKNKLQKQVDFLEQNPDYSICFHSVKVLENNIESEDKITKIVPDTTTIIDLAKNNYIHTPSVVYRNRLFGNFPEYFIKSPIGDYFIHMLNAKYGKIKYMNESMAVYRVHHTSYWSSKKQIEREQIWIDFIENIKCNFDKKIQQILENQIFKIKYKRMGFFEKVIYKTKHKVKKIFKFRI